MKKIAVLITVCVALVGCSNKFVYDNMDWILLEYLDDYVELNNHQEEVVSQKIAVLSEWHRREEIPNYIEHLDELMAIEPSTFTLEQLETQQDKLRQHSQRLVARIAPELYGIARELSNDQVEELMDSIRVRHTKYKNKYQQLSDQQIKANYKERIEENLETWLGSLTNQQQNLLDKWVDELLITSHDWVNHQTQMRVEMKSLLANRFDVSQFQPELQQLMFHSERLYAPELEQKIAHNRKIGSRYLVKVINVMTPKQIEHYRDEISDWRQLALDIQ
ncbi:hypothetical protein NM22_07435 [Vibrio tubiashii]|nr:hypothetical protein NM22_07435 [Vibrio tubiashii]